MEAEPRLVRRSLGEGGKATKPSKATKPDWPQSRREHRERRESTNYTKGANCTNKTRIPICAIRGSPLEPIANCRLPLRALPRLEVRTPCRLHTPAEIVDRPAKHVRRSEHPCRQNHRRHQYRPVLHAMSPLTPLPQRRPVLKAPAVAAAYPRGIPPNNQPSWYAQRSRSASRSPPRRTPRSAAVACDTVTALGLAYRAERPSLSSLSVSASLPVPGGRPGIVNLCLIWPSRGPGPHEGP